MSKYLTVGSVTSICQTLLGVAAAVFPGIFTTSIQAEATTVVAGLIGGIFGAVSLAQHLHSAATTQPATTK